MSSSGRSGCPFAGHPARGARLKKAAGKSPVVQSPATARTHLLTVKSRAPRRREVTPGISVSSFVPLQPTAADLAPLLPLISATDRLFLRQEGGDLLPLRWDDGEGWTFEVEARRVPGEERYEITGAFFRAGERLAAEAPEHVFGEGVLLRDGMLAPYSGPPNWISLFRREGNFFVPVPEADQWLEAMTDIRPAPVLRLPAELRLEEAAPRPQPALRIRTRKEAWGAPYLSAELEFRYLDRTVAEGDPSPAIVLVRERKRILRDPEAERAGASGSRRRVPAVPRLARRRLDDHGGLPGRRRPGAGRIRLVRGGGGEDVPQPKHLTLRIARASTGSNCTGRPTSAAAASSPRLLAALRRRQGAVRLDDGGYGMPPEEWVRKYRVLAGLGHDEGDHVRFRRHPGGLLDALLETMPEVSCDALFAHIRSEMCSFEGCAPPTPLPGFASCAPTSARGLGWFHSRAFQPGGAWPTTWGSARPSRCWRCSKSAARSASLLARGDAAPWSSTGSRRRAASPRACAY